MLTHASRHTTQVPQGWPVSSCSPLYTAIQPAVVVGTMHLRSKVLTLMVVVARQASAHDVLPGARDRGAPEEFSVTFPRWRLRCSSRS